MAAADQAATDSMVAHEPVQSPGKSDMIIPNLGTTPAPDLLVEGEDDKYAIVQHVLNQIRAAE